MPKPASPKGWTAVIRRLTKLRPHEKIHVPKADISHPLQAGFAQSRVGWPRGQKADWRIEHGGTAVHVREHGGEYVVHRDRVHPKGLWGHIKHFYYDLPGVAAPATGLGVGGTALVASKISKESSMKTNWDSYFDELEKLGGVRDALRYLLTGRATLRHGTSPAIAEKIRRHGLKASKTIGDPSWPGHLAFTTRKPSEAQSYAAMNAAGEALLGKARMGGKSGLSQVMSTASEGVAKTPGIRDIPKIMRKVFSGTRKGTVEIRVPAHKLKGKVIPNPEAGGLIHRALLAPHAVFKGKPGEKVLKSKYMIGPKYEKVKPKEVWEHAVRSSKKPKQFLGELARSATGIQANPLRNWRA